ncbi:alpha,alpha-phosphotrehalase [Exiguobacterium antarcticum]|uniref:alpha,alpha-phosphotrehalase n=1 Tax=Exiguobacterium antarcticum TaxID=132920 RepID=UPI000285EB9B|nr:alpha,alpha-phosphotrehalase [Exiguobacterium antarcticum]AFS71606.1 Alpha,alpha-phosphotrehalase [Exiguobacterium antarcticum B7]
MTLTTTDWRKSAVYQIYPKSFYSPEGKATGTLRGVTAKLDYLAKLGVDYLWLTPVYASPQRDNGYDVSDYYAIDPSYGTMADFDELLAEANKRQLSVMMDIVVNHCSTDHDWFKQGRHSESPYHDYFIWRDQPTDWVSKFGGPAWSFDDVAGKYYLHLFDETQADLNWENPALREAIYQMMCFWRDKGVRGFRLDVINLISKDDSFANDPTGDGRKYYTDGPRVHDYLQEMNQRVFDGHDLMTVGEMSSTTLEHCLRYSNTNEQELKMTFNFHHLKVDYPDGQKWTAAPFDFLELKRILSDWQVGMQGNAWNAIFWCNHDQPRVVSRFGDDTVYRVESAKMLATTLHGLQGTPYIYQGEEIGTPNPDFTDLTDYRDVETLNAYTEKTALGETEADILAAIRQKSRDNARTPMQWDASPHAGFSTATPWIPVASNHTTINVEAALADSNSVFYHYKKLIQLRKQYDVLTNGSYRLLTPDDLALWAYERTNDDEQVLVLSNFYGTAASFTLPNDWLDHQVLIQNYPDFLETSGQVTLRPYESIMLYRTV